MQILSLGTGAAVVAATLPGALSGVGIAAAIGVAVGTVAVLAWPPATRLAARVIPGLAAEGHALHAGRLALAATATLLAWMAYGLAFWLVAQAVLPDPDLSLASATGAFTASYIVGLLTVIAPGGLLVREGLILELLNSTLGAPGAVVLGVASRAVLTATELTAAAIGLIVWRRIAVPPGRRDTP